MTAAQKAAKANFKKAIEYRKKTGVSLKEAFAHVYGKKVGAAPKKKAAKKAAPKKAAKKVVKKKAAPKKIGLSIAKKAAAKVKSLARKAQDAYYEGFYEGKPAALAKKRAELKKKRVSAAKKKVSEKQVLNKIHRVKNEVNQLDELQHKHMSGLPKYRNAVRVYFSNPKYNYTTAVGPYVTEESAKQYFLGKYFNVGVYPKEILQKPTRIKFFKYIDK